MGFLVLSTETRSHVTMTVELVMETLQKTHGRQPTWGEVVCEGPVGPINPKDVEEELDNMGGDTDDPSDPVESSDEEVASVY